MKIIDLKKYFTKALSGIYPVQEIENFFYLLTYEYLKLNRVAIALEPNEEINFKVEQKYNSAIAQLKKEVPIQYILGKTAFYGLTLYIDKNVLIPRPETEELVSWVIKNIPTYLNEQKISILDIGTGSGCIAISLAKNIKNVNIWALDISEKALKIAQKNANHNNVQVQFINYDILNINQLPNKFDIIVSNPPYVRELEKTEINNNVLKHEPHVALFVKDKNPLLFYDKIADFAKKNLRNKGQLYFEINQYLGEETKSLLIEKGYKNIELKKDVFENDRMLRANLN